MAKQMYEILLGNLKQSNERLWFNACLRLGKIYLDQKQYDALESILVEMKEMCKDPSNPNTFDVNKGSTVLEISALEIEKCIECKENRRMKQVFQMTEQFSTVIEDSRIQGVLKECGGKMYMSEKKWLEAEELFWAGFKSLVDSGANRAVTLLKYVILTSVLADSEIDRMTTQEAQVFKDDISIVAMKDLKEGFKNDDVKKILSVVNDKKVNLLED